MQAGEPAFLSLVRWPEGMERDALIGTLSAAAGADPFYAGQRLAKGTAPAVIQRIDAAVAGEVLEELRRRGVHAIAPTLTELRSFAPPIRAKRLAPALGAPEPMYLCEPWRGESFGFAAKDIAIMVRARLGRTHAGPTRAENAGTVYEPVTGTVIPLVQSVRDVRSTLSDILDIYLRDRRRIRCSGDKFNFEILGSDRGLTDNENMDKLSVLLAESAPRAIVDLGFADFTCPPAVVSAYRTTPGGSSVKDDHPVFDFYSPWIVQVYRALAGGERSR